MFLVELGNDSTYIVVTIFCLIISIVAIIFLCLWIKHNFIRYKEESMVILDDAISKTTMKRLVNKYIHKVGSYGVCSFLYVDIDGFGDLNEVLGVKVCDEILKQVAINIIRVIPFNAALSLYKNDEFLVFIKEESNSLELERLAKKICDAVNQEYHVTSVSDVSVSCSVGIATYPQCGTTLDELTNNLELATYISKRDGGNRYTSYYSSLNEHEKENYEFFLEIKKAIKNKEFVLYYQPIIDLEKNTIIGAEALMRWNHPTEGVVSPQKFIPILEQSGDIKWVGEWGIETIVKQYLALSTKYPEFDLKLSLNLSTKQLLNPKLSTQFIEILKRYSIEANHFMLEIGEYTAYDRLGSVKNNLLKLRDYGFLIAVDGFDLDEYALNNIERAPIDIIKLDRSFLSGDKTLMKEKFVELLVTFCDEYGHELICEGVENGEMVEYIKSHNIKYAQGYLYSKPISEEDFMEYIQNRGWRNVNKATLEINEVVIEENTSDKVVEEGNDLDLDFLSDIDEDINI